MKNTMYPHPVIAERIEQVMKDNRLIDKDVAQAVGLERKAIFNYRNCVSNPHIAVIRYLSERYKVSLEWLLAMDKGV